MARQAQFVLVALLFGVLIFIRFFEGELFYDPMLQFFKVDHSTAALPSFDLVKLLAHVLLRFLLNTVVSLLILWLLFRKKGIVTLSAFFYGVLFLVLMTAFVLLIHSSEIGEHMALFYVRRFLIQPLLLLLLIPAFYFQKKS